jgi:large subunit ribosomal protein L33
VRLWKNGTGSEQRCDGLAFFGISEVPVPILSQSLYVYGSTSILADISKLLCKSFTAFVSGYVRANDKINFEHLPEARVGTGGEPTFPAKLKDSRAYDLERLIQGKVLMAKKKGGRRKKKAETVFLVCEETGDRNYSVRKKPGGEKLKLSKYSQRLRKHTVHNEKKK